MSEIQTNLRVLKPSRKKPREGDVFAMQLVDQFLFGRVISTEARWALGQGADPAVLIYIYHDPSTEKDVPERSSLRPDRLLVPPVMTNKLPWSRGYFETLTNITLESDEVLAQHCFLSASRGRYFDENGADLGGGVEPVGDYGLHSYRTIDDQLSHALGIPLAPES